MILLIPYINLLNLPWIKQNVYFLRNMETLTLLGYRHKISQLTFCWIPFVKICHAFCVLFVCCLFLFLFFVSFFLFFFWLFFFFFFFFFCCCFFFFFCFRFVLFRCLCLFVCLYSSVMVYINNILLKPRKSWPRWLSWMRVRLMIRRLLVRPLPGRQHSFMEIDYEILSTAILSLPLIQEGQF